MKNFLKFLGVALIAAFMTMSFVACNDPDEDPDVPPAPEGYFNVVFNSNGGSAVETQQVKEGGKATMAFSRLDYAPPAEVGLWKAYKTLKWQLDGKDYDFNTPVTANITLKASWSDPANELDEAKKVNTSDPLMKNVVAYLNNKRDEYILKIDEDQTNVAPLTLNAAGANLSIFSKAGLNGVKKISMAETGKGSLFTVSGANVSLTIGAGITLEGNDANNKPLVTVMNEANLYLIGGTISKNTNDGTSYVNGEDNSGYGVGGVHVDNATFTIFGSLTNLTNGNTGSKGFPAGYSAGAVYAEAGGQIIVLGGTFTSNTNQSGKGTSDIYITRTSKVKLDGIAGSASAVVGEICLGSPSGTTYGKIEVTPNFTYTCTLGLNGTTEGATDGWAGKTVLDGATAAQQAKVTLGKLYAGNTTGTAITDTLEWDSTAVGKLKKK